jgi:hypothetical protein
MMNDMIDWNRSIATFMGAKSVTIKDLLVNMWTSYPPLEGRLDLSTTLKFHEDWNMLIPVYSKIMLTCREEDPDVSISGVVTYDDDIYDLQNKFEEAVFGNRIDLAFDAIVTFLKYYNERGNNK